MIASLMVFGALQAKPTKNNKRWTEPILRLRSSSVNVSRDFNEPEEVVGMNSDFLARMPTPLSDDQGQYPFESRLARPANSACQYKTSETRERGKREKSAGTVGSVRPPHTNTQRNQRFFFSGLLSASGEGRKICLNIK